MSKKDVDDVVNGAVEKKEPVTAGIAQRVREARADATKTEPSEIGIGWTGEEALQRGRDLKKQGVSVDDIIDDFKKDHKISDDTMAVVQATAAEFAHQTNLAGDKFGIDSPEYRSCLAVEKSFLDEVKPMQTVWSRVGAAQMGEVEVDTGSYTGLQRAFRSDTGKEFTPSQSKIAKELAAKVKELSDKEAEWNTKLQEALGKLDEAEKKAKTPREIKAASKRLADKVRTAKLHRPEVFMSATPASLAWDLGVETVAKSIEAGGEIAQAISDGIDAIKKTDWYKGLNDKTQKEAEKQFVDHHNEIASGKIDIATHFIDKRGNTFTLDEVKAIWQHMKDDYIDKGITDFDDVITNVAADSGLRPDQVRRAIIQPKAVRTITDQMYKVRGDRARAIQNAKLWVKSADTPMALKFLKAVPGFFFGLKVFGHGTVGGITHMGMEIFRPSGWKRYWPNFFKQFNFAYGNDAKYQAAMADHVRDADYIFWKRAGLAVDPLKIYDDYQLFSKYFGRLGRAGDRGFNVLKIHRLQTAKSIWEHLSNQEKSDPNSAKEIAKIVNHSTGTADVKIPNALNTVFFAPRLEASRWMRIVAEPAQAATTFMRWNKASTAERVAAKLTAKGQGKCLQRIRLYLPLMLHYYPLRDQNRRLILPIPPNRIG